MDLQALLGGIAIGVIVGFMASYPVGFLREVGRHRAAKMLARREDQLRLRQSDVEAAAAVAAGEADEITAQTQIVRVRAERLGSMFIRRETRDDLGIEVEVVDLDPRQPLDRVIVRHISKPGRAPTPYDPPKRLNVEWLLKA